MSQDFLQQNTQFVLLKKKMMLFEIGAYSLQYD